MRAESPRLRILTYNVHRCVGCDGVLSPARVAQVIGHFEADVVALQELDVGHGRTGHVDQPAILAETLGMSHLFFPAIAAGGAHYGVAILSRYPMELIRAGPLPTLPLRPDLERRGALWVAVHGHGRTLQVLNTHLGLNRRERLAQVDALLGPEWLGHPACREPRVLCGDFNAWPGSLAYGRLSRAMHDVLQGRGRFLRKATFPSGWPLLRLDHVFLSPDLTVQDVRIPRTSLTRVASDHLPLLADVLLP